MLGPDDVGGVEHGEQFGELRFRVVLQALGQAEEALDFVPFLLDLVRVVGEDLTEDPLIDPLAFLFGQVLVFRDVPRVAGIGGSPQKPLLLRLRSARIPQDGEDLVEGAQPVFQRPRDRIEAARPAGAA
ncbi:MAG: hypothetical protein KatS3mg131_0253 [Candidatus Tectimicrobiota bacterium]|nr:MAG: hypothetical protein KatS3mg131_0253 [Candidatus Tectomicrobia bacterium]